jgi:BirA family biotin operon repressor/biotin-[acetyl-CoA-carboxylase] ligase
VRLPCKPNTDGLNASAGSPSAAPSTIGRWTLLEYPEVTSTNLVSAQLPTWHAVRADRQTGGRGRFQRSWVSDAGGLWLSAVVPAEGEAARLLPLAAGLAVAEALQSFGVHQLRLRWPNDVMIGSRKLAGLLVDQFLPGRAVVGIGINCQNRPEQEEPALTGYVTRLSDWLAPVPAISEVLRRVLAQLADVIARLHHPETLLPRINALWQTSIPVEIDLDGLLVTGQFEGIDVRGRLRLIMPGGETRLLEPHEVRLFREIP